MNKSKAKATIIIVVFLVVCAAIAALATGHTLKNKTGGGQTAQETQQPAGESQSPAEESDTPTDTPQPSPSETVEPSAEPSKAPAVSRSVSGSGSFASDTGTPLNLLVKWSASAVSDTEISVTFDMYLNCYTINATPKPGGASVTVNGQTYTASTPELNSSSATPTSVKLCSKTVTMSLGAGESLSVPVSASWAFGGSYSDVDLETIDASGTLSIQG